MSKERLDKLVVDLGLAENRSRAHSMIMAGQVFVAGQRVDKPGRLIDPSAEIEIKGERLRYVGRGGLKLEAALREFVINPDGKDCIDIGASTGGFTDCLLQHGARSVHAIDVGQNQLAWKLRRDDRVTVMERVNARLLDASTLPSRFHIAVIDVSFISVSLIIPRIPNLLLAEADCIVLVKPQFEVGKGEVGKGGIVKDPAKHRRVIEEVIEAAKVSGLVVRGLIASPILGAEGNREFLLHLTNRHEGIDFRVLEEQIQSAVSK